MGQFAVLMMRAGALGPCIVLAATSLSQPASADVVRFGGVCIDGVTKTVSQGTNNQPERIAVEYDATAAPAGSARPQVFLLGPTPQLLTEADEKFLKKPISGAISGGIIKREVIDPFNDPSGIDPLRPFVPGGIGNPKFSPKIGGSMGDVSLSTLSGTKFQSKNLGTALANLAGTTQLATGSVQNFSGQAAPAGLQAALASGSKPLTLKPTPQQQAEVNSARKALGAALAKEEPGCLASAGNSGNVILFGAEVSRLSLKGTTRPGGLTVEPADFILLASRILQPGTTLNPGSEDPAVKTAKDRLSVVLQDLLKPVIKNKADVDTLPGKDIQIGPPSTGSIAAKLRAVFDNSEVDFRVFGNTTADLGAAGMVRLTLERTSGAKSDRTGNEGAVRLAFEKLMLSRLDLSESAAFDAVWVQDAATQVTAIYDVAGSTLRFVDGDLVADSKLSVQPGALRAGTAALDLASLTAQSGRLKFSANGFTVSLDKVAMGVRSLVDPAMGVGATDLTLGADVIHLSRVYDNRGVRIRQFSAFAVQGLTGSSPLLGLSAGQSSSKFAALGSAIGGPAQISAERVDGLGVRNLQLRVTPIALGVLQDLGFGRSLGAFTIRADGPWSGGQAFVDLPASSLDVTPFRLTSVPALTAGPIRMGGAVINLPFDIDTAGPSGKLELWGSAAMTLSGSVDRLRLKGVVSIGGTSASLRIAPHGLEIRLSGAASSAPWVLGGTPQFATADLTLTSPEGLAAREGASSGSIEIAAAGLVVADPKIALSGGAPNLAINLPLKSAAEVVLALRLPEGQADLRSGRMSVERINATTLGDLPVKVGDMVLTKGSFSAGLFVVSGVGDRMETEIRDLNLAADRIEQGGAGGQQDSEGSTYWSAKLDAPFKVELLKARLKRDEAGRAILVDGTLRGLSLKASAATVRTKDGVSYDGSTLGLTVDNLSTQAASSRLSVGPGKVAFRNGSFNSRGLEMSLVGVAPRYAGRIQLGLLDIAVEQPFDMKVVDECDVNHSDNFMRFRGQLAVASVDLAGTLDEKGVVRATGSMVNPATKVGLAKGFNCSFKRRIDIEVRGRVGYRIPTPWGDIKDEKEVVLFRGNTDLTFIGILDALQMGFGFGQAYFVMKEGKVHACLLAPYPTVLPGALLSVGIGPATGIEYLDRFIAEGTARIAEPLMSSFASSVLQVGTLGALFAAQLGGGVCN